MKVQVNYYNNTVDGSEMIDPALVTATDNAEPTSRVLSGSEDGGYAQEWQEPAIMPDGRKCNRMYLFTQDEIDAVEDAEDLPWDDEHVVRIILID